METRIENAPILAYHSNKYRIFFRTVSMKLVILAVLALLPFAQPGGAQTLSDDELLRRFQAQKQLFDRARQGETEAGRGFELFTVEDLRPGETRGSQGAPAGPGAGSDAGTPPPVVDASGLQPLSGLATVIGVTRPAGETRPAASGTVASGTGAPAVTGGTEAAPRLVVAELPADLQVNMNIRFRFDSATVAQDQAPALDRLCRVMKRTDIALFRIIGHTDAVGADDYNRKLSQLRAEEVERRLVRDCGIAPARLEAVGLGETLLANPADPRAAENRRVEVQALG